jgi:hypothetical protein
MRSNQVTFGLLLCNNLLRDWASVSSYVKSVPREMPGRNDIEKTLWADPPRTQHTARLAHDRITCKRLVGVKRPKAGHFSASAMCSVTDEPGHLWDFAACSADRS